MPTKEEIETSKSGEEGAKSQHDEVEEVFDDEIEEAEHEDEPDAYALRMEEAEKERELMARATPNAARDEQLADLSGLDAEDLEEDIAQYGQPDMDILSERSRRAEEAQGLEQAKKE